MLEIKGYSPSNIETGWRQKYYFKIDSDSILDRFVKIFAENGNEWNMKTDEFDAIVEIKEMDRSHGFRYIYQDALEIDGDHIHLKKRVAEELLKNNWVWSFRNLIKQSRGGIRTALKGFKEIFGDAFAFIFDPEAKLDSGLKYPHGGPISVRLAKKQGLIKTDSTNRSK